MIRFNTRGIFYSLLITCFICTSLKAQYRGADISWHDNIEAADGTNVSWRWPNGNAANIHELLKTNELDAVRFRVWYNNSGDNGKDEVVWKAKLAAERGMDIMLTFHYSNSWADPGQQYKPWDWPDDIPGITTKIYEHTYDVVNAVKDAIDNSTVTNKGSLKWVQIGNETNNGMCWKSAPANETKVLHEDSTTLRDENWNITEWKKKRNFKDFINSGHNAVKAVDNSIQTIVHLANAQSYDDIYDVCSALKEYNAQYDILGLSLYPASNWGQDIKNYAQNVAWVKNDFSKDVMLVEVGLPYEPSSSAYDALKVILKVTESLDNALGVFYWHPDDKYGWGQGKQAWNPDGKFNNTMTAFKYNNYKDEDVSWYLPSTARKSDNEITKRFGSITLYPNPANNELTIAGLSEGNYEITIVDLSGNLKGVYQANTLERQIDLSGLSGGVYMIKISNQSVSATMRFMKQ